MHRCAAEKTLRLMKYGGGLYYVGLIHRWRKRMCFEQAGGNAVERDRMATDITRLETIVIKQRAVTSTLCLIISL